MGKLFTLYSFVIVSSYTTSLPSPIKSPYAVLGKAHKQRRGLETQPVFGEPSGEIMSLLKDVKA